MERIIECEPTGPTLGIPNIPTSILLGIATILCPGRVSAELEDWRQLSHATGRQAQIGFLLLGTFGIKRHVIIHMLANLPKYRILEGSSEHQIIDACSHCFIAGKITGPETVVSKEQARDLVVDKLPPLYLWNPQAVTTLVLLLDCRADGKTGYLRRVIRDVNGYSLRNMLTGTFGITQREWLAFLCIHTDLQPNYSYYPQILLDIFDYKDHPDESGPEDAPGQYTLHPAWWLSHFTQQQQAKLDRSTMIRPPVTNPGSASQGPPPHWSSEDTDEGHNSGD